MSSIPAELNVWGFTRRLQVFGQRRGGGVGGRPVEGGTFIPDTKGELPGNLLGSIQIGRLTDFLDDVIQMMNNILLSDRVILAKHLLHKAGDRQIDTDPRDKENQQQFRKDGV